LFGKTRKSYSHKGFVAKQKPNKTKQNQTNPNKTKQNQTNPNKNQTNPYKIQTNPNKKQIGLIVRNPSQTVVRVQCV
jgi:hypothetical protein